MSQPILDSLHRRTLRKQQACTGVSEVMETEFLQLIPTDYTLEVICYEVRGNELAEIVSAHKAVIPSSLE